MIDSNSKRPRRRYSEADREKILGEYRKSGLSQARFANTTGLCISTLRNWLWKSRESKAGSRSGDLIPVRLLPGHGSTEPAARGLLEIELATGSVIRMSPGFNPNEVRELVKILRESC